MNSRPDRALSVSVSHPVEGTCVVSLAGDLDIASSVEFGSTLETLTAGGRVRVIVEISGVEFIDTSGLNALVVGAREADRAGGSLTVVAPSPYVARVFELVRIGESLDVVGSIEDAMTHVGAPIDEAAS